MVILDARKAYETAKSRLQGQTKTLENLQNEPDKSAELYAAKDAELERNANAQVENTLALEVSRVMYTLTVVQP